MVTRQLLWWLEQRQARACGPDEVKAFLAYVASPAPEGRWGLPTKTRGAKAVTAVTYYSRLRTFFRFLVAEELIASSPMERVKPPVYRPDQIAPFSEDQVRALLAAARRDRYPERDEALLYFMLDTGVRASELCALRLVDVDLDGRRAVVHGKGNKDRTLPFSPTTARAYRKFHRTVRNATPDMPLFVSEQGGPLTPSGLQQILRRLGLAAGVRGVRCSPHTFRHTAAVMFLRAGGHVFALKELLGHTTLTITSRYVALAQADLQEQHALFSPVEALKLKRSTR